MARATNPGGGRGRPTGSNPFRGSAFEVCQLLLLQRARDWSARALALELGHSPSLVLRALKELERRGYLTRSESGVRLNDPLALRNDLLLAWRERLDAPRAAQAFIARSRTGLLEAVRAHATGAGSRCVLAGPSAATGATALIGEALTVYLDQSALEVMRGSGREPAAGALGDLVAWPPPEPAVFAWPLTADGNPATNRLITFLDLASSGSERHRMAAEAVCGE